MTSDEYETLAAPANGVEILKGDAAEPGGDTLVIDGAEVWRDHRSEPEDAILSRDLADVVRAVRRLAAERDNARAAARLYERESDAWRALHDAHCPGCEHTHESVWQVALAGAKLRVARR